MRTEPLRVGRPEPPQQEWHAALADRKRRLQAVLGREPRTLMNVGSPGAAAENLLQYASLVARDDPVLPEAVRMVARSSTAQVLLSARPRGEPVRVPYGDRYVVMEAVGPNSNGHMGTWKNGWQSALVARDEECLALLATIPDDVIRVSSSLGSIGDECEYPWKAALVAFRADPESALPLLDRAVALAEPEHVIMALPGSAAVRRATYPLLGYLVHRDAEAFNQGLYTALAAHRAYWGTPEQSNARNGFISWQIMAMACLAHDAGMPIRVESDYLLPSLIQRAGGY